MNWPKRLGQMTSERSLAHSKRTCQGPFQGPSDGNVSATSATFVKTAIEQLVTPSDASPSPPPKNIPGGDFFFGFVLFITRGDIKYQGVNVLL